ncbi:MAG: beta-lactamase family protein [Clostridiales bacterium]|nr:beta-lactamase family protein [Clostridiales bacterium]
MAIIMSVLKNTKLEHTSPESVGIKSSVIKAFIDEINEKKLGLQSFTVVRRNKVCAQCFWKPYSAEYPHVLYSMSKSVTSTAVGFAVSEGLLKLDDKVSDFFPEYLSAKLPMNRQLTVEMLLTMRSDKMITVLDEKGSKDWVKQFFDAPFMLPPNTKFNYISENTFMLSAIISKVTGMSMVDYLYPRMFEPLGIEKPFWETDGKGNNSAGWGLYMKSEDLAKFFLPYINDGKWTDGTQLIPAQWVETATAKHTDSVHDGYIDNMCGYGYQFWRNPVANSFRADGLFGQRCFMFPEYDALVVLNSGESEDYKIMKVFWKYFPSCFENDSLSENGIEYNELLNTVSACSVEELEPASRNFSAENLINGKTIKCKTNKFTSVISISILNMLYNKPGDINEMRLDFDEHGLNFTWKEKDEVNTVHAGMNGEYGVSEIKLKDLHYHAFSKAAWQEDGKLKLWIRPVETAHVRKFTFDFSHTGKVKIKNEMAPTFEELAIYNFTFLGMPIKYKTTEEFVQRAIRDLGLPILEPNINGKFI